MRNASHKVDMADLLVHADWVRQLASRLVSNAAQAEDVVQDTWVAALERPPGRAQNLRGWLSRVVRNVARQRGRSDSRRAYREQETARADTATSTAELVERAALQRNVVDHLLSLDEPFRTVVLLRFFEGLQPREIAARLGVPVKTVNSRLQRAFAKLHERLDTEYGDRATWCLALLPLCATPDLAAGASSSLFTQVGGWILKTNTKVGVAVAASLLGGLGLWQVLPEGDGTHIASPSAAPPAVEAPVAAATQIAEERSALAREPEVATEPQVPSAAIEEPAVELLSVRGRAVDVSGSALSGVGIATESAPEEVLVTTAPDGSFSLEIAKPGDQEWKAHPDQTCLRVADSNLRTLWQSCVRETNALREHIVVATPVIAIEGSVVTTGSAPVSGAEVKLSVRNTALHGFPYPLDMTSPIELAGSTDPTGAFRFERFPEAPGLLLHVFAEGYAPSALDLDAAQQPYVITLTRTQDLEGTFVEGIVVDERRAPVAGAVVQLANKETRSDPQGFFRVQAEHVQPDTPICAAKKGLLPALIPSFGQLLDAQKGAVGPIELVLGGAPLDVRGRIVDRAGEPCAGWSVSVLDETEISQFVIPLTTAEGLARDGQSVVRTGKDGSFHLTGLFPREYRLQAFDEKTLFRAEAVVTAGDQSVRIEVAKELRSDVRGVVVNARGQPLSNVVVRACLDTVKGKIGSSNISGQKVVTDEEGGFVFDAMPRDYVYLRLSGEAILPAKFEFPLEGSGGPYEVAVFQRCHFRIELAGGPQAGDAIELFDADGTRLQVNSFTANGMNGYPFVRLTDGRSEVLSVSELATTAVVLRGGIEVGRHAIALDSEIVNELRL